VAKAAKVTTYVLIGSDGRRATARKVGDRPPVVRMRYRGVGSGRRLRSAKKTEIERERR
jgi:hypothetical protein